MVASRTAPSTLLKIAALAIVFDRPFRRGDTVRYGNGTDVTVGTVERIGLKTTRLRSQTGEQVIMANTKLLEQEVRNLAEAKVRRVTLLFRSSSCPSF